MDRVEFIEKVEKQHYYIDMVDAFILCSIFTDLYGLDYTKDFEDMEEELVYMWCKICVKVKDKYCTRCETFKDKKDFTHNSSAKDGLSYYCISCAKDYRVSNKKRKVKL